MDSDSLVVDQGVSGSRGGFRCRGFRSRGFRSRAFDNGVVVAIAREAHALRNASREVLDMHDVHDEHDVQMEHRDRLDAEGQSVELYASRPS